MSSVDGEVAIDATTDTTVIEPAKKKKVVKEVIKEEE